MATVYTRRLVTSIRSYEAPGVVCAAIAHTYTHTYWTPASKTFTPQMENDHLPVHHQSIRVARRILNTVDRPSLNRRHRRRHSPRLIRCTRRACQRMTLLTLAPLRRC